jgi:hypothetical protein
MSIEARNRPLPDWFTRIRTHQTVLPRFQRFEAWGHTSVIQLFNTILQDLPVGAVLVLDVGNEEPFISRTIKGAPEAGERVTEHLLDGQQRLTALWRGPTIITTSGLISSTSSPMRRRACRITWTRSRDGGKRRTLSPGLFGQIGQKSSGKEG